MVNPDDWMKALAKLRGTVKFFAPKFKKDIEKDLLILFTQRDRVGGVAKVQEFYKIHESIYYLYNTPAIKRDVTEERLLAFRSASQVSETLLRSYPLRYKSDPPWSRWYTYQENPSDETFNVRFYVNPKIEGMAVVLKEILEYYYTLPPAQRGNMKFKFIAPGSVQSAYIERSDKIVFYVSKKHELHRKIRSFLGKINPRLLETHRPLFTHKVNEGIGMTWEPKKESVFLRWLRETHGHEERVSFGSYMAKLIASGIGEALIITGIYRKNQMVSLHMLTDEQIKKIFPILLQYIFKHLETDLPSF